MLRTYVCLVIKKNETLSLAIRWMDLEDIMASEIIPAEEGRLPTMFHMGKLRKLDGVWTEKAQGRDD